MLFFEKRRWSRGLQATNRNDVSKMRKMLIMLTNTNTLHEEGD